MKIILLISFLIGTSEMIAIKPILWTNAQIEVTKISVEVVNETAGSVDFAWRFYNDTDSLIDYGVMQIGAITMDITGKRIVDSNFIYYQSNPDSFALNYVMSQKGLIPE